MLRFVANLTANIRQISQSKDFVRCFCDKDVFARDILATVLDVDAAVTRAHRAALQVVALTAAGGVGIDVCKEHVLVQSHATHCLVAEFDVLAANYS